ncbi:putative RNA polymerase sigma factor FecI [Pigmentiphaga humi]|uniref:Putative RNA polymerase sigma factor FecI n=1 Tax=Pigmentiphaga humi TaxID=2478468 RepID=A0A3P4B690_9BURK|nr:sigma-70 family RNA polymerase sigma factor [Pigmentiphaga humi]VCU71824.1 putative RNA polymerase sigma factor FecI [Pigmentiphaga humi]
MAQNDLSGGVPIDGLFRDHRGWLQGWLRRKLGNSADAADLLQETFLRVLGGRTAFRFQASDRFDPRRQLALIANGLVISKWRRDALEREYLAALAAMEPASAPSPEARAVAFELLCEIDAMLDELPPKCRQAFLLAQLDGMCQQRIAAELGVTRRTVHNYLARAMVACSVYLMKQGG